MEKNVKIAILLDIYGSLLTEKQYKLLDDYYNKDLSLSEIGENENITRQAVRDNLLKGENNLFEYESKLGLMKKQEKNQDCIKKINEEIDELKKVVTDKKELKMIEQIKKHINKI